MRHIYLKISLLILVVIFTTNGYSYQNTSNQSPKIENDSTIALNQSTDSTNIEDLKPISLLDSLIKNSPKAQMEATIPYHAKDSLIIFFDKKQMVMFGNGGVDYDKFKLESEKIGINYETHVIDASGVADSTGNVKGKPVFSDEGKVYETDSIRYNFLSQKAFISGVVTQEGEGFLHGSKIKKGKDNTSYIDKAKYTTCNLPDPHFHIQASRIKMIPGNKMISGPFNIHIMDIPTPLGLPFGLFPMPKKSASGIIFPTFGDEQRRGFFLRDGGYYFHFSEYIDLKLLGEIYTKGSYGLSAYSRYRKRYKYSGNFSVRYNDQEAESEADKSNTQSYWINWSHSPVSRPGQGRFSASVNFGSTKFNQLNDVTINNNLSQNFSSNISYSKSLGSMFNLSTQANLTQNISTGDVNLKLPSFNLSMNRINPFLKKGKPASTWYENINFNYSLDGQNNMTNRLPSAPSLPTGISYENFPNTTQERDAEKIGFSFSNIDEIWRRSQQGLQHRIPVSTSMKVLKYFSLTPSFNWNEITYFKKLHYEYNEATKKIRIDTLGGVQRVYNYNTGASLNTNIYGIKHFKKGRLKAIRHVMRPSISYSFTPDYTDDYYQTIKVDDKTTLRLSEYHGFAYGAPASGKSSSLSFSLSNQLEMKIQPKTDTANAETKPKIVSLLDNLSFSGSYNFAADSMNLSNIGISARTRLFNKKVSVNFNATLDPYAYARISTEDETGKSTESSRRTSTYAWNAGKGLGQITNWSLAVSTSLNPKARDNKNNLVNELSNKAYYNDAVETEINYILSNPQAYLDFNIPWNLTFNYNINYSKRGYDESTVTQGMRFSGDFSLTEKWKTTFSSGYDFEKDEFTQTNIGINRDLHCWQMTLNWIPFGRYQSYGFTIRAKSSLLQDLKLNKQNSWRDRF